MDKENDPPKMTASPEEIADIEKRLGKKETLTIFSDREVKIILSCLRFNTWIQERLSRAKLSIRRLRKLFGFTSEKQAKKKSKKLNTDQPSHGTSGEVCWGQLRWKNWRIATTTLCAF